MSVYWDILAAVQTKVQTIPGITITSVKIRPKPMVHKEDTLPLVVICPRKDSWDEIAELQFENNLHIDYPVMVALIIESTFDQTGLKYQLNMRDSIRRKLFSPTLFADAISSVFNVRYNPNPRGADTSALASNLDPSFQEFTYRSSETRSA